MCLRHAAFTLAEVLITLGIIGIVAALTIPNLVADYEKKHTIAKLQKATAVLSQMMIQSYADNGAVSHFLKSGKAVDADEAKEFFYTFWLPYFKSVKVSPDSVYPYSEQEPYTRPDGSSVTISIFTQYSHGRIYFTTADGMSYYVHIMGWDNNDDNKIIPGSQHYVTTQYVYVDINGTKGPNVMGKDVFYLIADFDDNRLLPYCSDKTKKYINNDCSATGKGNCCAAKIINDGWRIADDYPW